MSEQLHKNLFDSTDCLSEETLYAYIDKKLTVEENYVVEKHLVDCELCSDALEGLALVKNRSIIGETKSAVKKLTAIDQKKEARVIPFNFNYKLAAAAAIALLVGCVFLMNHYLNERKEVISYNVQADQEKSPSAQTHGMPPEVEDPAPAEKDDRPKNSVNEGPVDNSQNQVSTWGDGQVSRYKERSDDGGSGLRDKFDANAAPKKAVAINTPVTVADPTSKTRSTSPSVGSYHVPETSTTEDITTVYQSEKISQSSSADKTLSKNISSTGKEAPDEIAVDTKAVQDGPPAVQSQVSGNEKAKNKKIESKKEAARKDYLKPEGADADLEKRNAADVGVSTTVEEPKRAKAQNVGGSVYKAGREETDESGEKDGLANSAVELQESPAQFPGGEIEKQKFILQKQNLKNCPGCTGDVRVNFVVSKAGKLKDVTPERNSVSAEKRDSSCACLVNEATRIVKVMPDWKPAEEKGQRVESKSSVTISFK